jgi:23S rRNA (cytidine1920-2'-O)/16S rRNA (cytidine1409-2'-O)-methyltransferase
VTAAGGRAPESRLHHGASGVRLDRLLVEQGLARSRGDAQELVRSGKVSVAGRTIVKPATVVSPGATVEVARPGPRWVGRGAHKLAHAVTLWSGHGLTVHGRRCLDVGASTGGFTQVLLEHGAAQVVALDVGHGQLAAELRADPRVTDLPGTHVRDVSVQALGGPADLLVADLSFIPLSAVLLQLRRLVVDDGDLVLLVKPQFEVGPQRVGRGGVVRSRAARRDAVHAVLREGYAAGLAAVAITTSPVAGSGGNVEYLLWARPARAGMMDAEAALALGTDVVAKEHP